VELAAGLLFTFLYWKFGLSLQLGMPIVYASLLTLIFVINLEHGLIPNRLIYLGMVVAFGFSFFWPELGW